MPTTQAPVIYVIGGPNGAGKTTFAREFLPAEGVLEFLNADSIAAGLSPLKPELMAIRAGRLLLERWHELVAARRTFAVESTLSGRSYATMLHRAREAGYQINLSYLWLPNAEFSALRVQQRVARGGHSIPDADLRRRYLPSLQNFFELYMPLAQEATLYRGAESPPQGVAFWTDGQLRVIDHENYERIKAQLRDERGFPA